MVCEFWECGCGSLAAEGGSAFSTSPPKASFKSWVEEALRMNPDPWGPGGSGIWGGTSLVGVHFLMVPVEVFLAISVLGMLSWLFKTIWTLLILVVIGIYIEKGFVDHEAIKGSLSVSKAQQ